MTTAANKVDLAVIEKIASPVIEGAGYELIELEWKREVGWVLRVLIDKPGGPHAPGEGITLDACADVNRELSTVLDVADVLPGADSYSLEVGSPGIDRPLRRAADFARVVGRKVKVRTVRPLGPPPGRRNFAGPLVSTTEAGLLSIDVGDRVCEVPLAEIEKAHLVFDWDAAPPKSKQTNGPKLGRSKSEQLKSDHSKLGHRENGSR